MSRYVVHGPDWIGNLPGEWSVETDDERYTVSIGPKGEANIIAFALNAIASGGALRALMPVDPDQTWDGHDPDKLYWHEYSGPKEGVAP